jgi:hypothetical protein
MTDSFVIVAGFGLTAHTSGREFSLRTLIRMLLELANLEPKQPQERNRQALGRWEQAMPAEVQQQQMWTVLVDNMPTVDLEAWNLLFATAKPVVTSTYDLQAATAMYMKVFGHDPATPADLKSVILTWKSPVAQLREFFTTGSVTSQTRVLYREGCVLTGDWLLGCKFPRARKPLERIDRMFASRSFLVVGIEHGIDCGFLKSKARQHKADFYRVVRPLVDARPGVTDIYCDYDPRDRFISGLQRILSELALVHPIAGDLEGRDQNA